MKRLLSVVFLILLVSLTGCIDNGGNNGGNNPPVAEFGFAPSNPTSLVDIQFVSAANESDGSITTVLWDFGEGNTSIEINPVHSYGKSGTYVVTLSVWDNNGVSSTISKSVIVSERPNTAPSDPSISAKTSSAKEPYLYYMFYFSSTDPEEDKIAYYYEWGDGSNGSTPRLLSSGSTARKQHAWNQPGTYTIKAKAVDEIRAESNWSSINVTIGEQTSAPDFSIETLDHGIFNLSANLGKVVVLTFTSTSCAFCNIEIDDLKEVYDEMGDNVSMISIYVKSYNPITVTIENITSVKEENDAQWMFALDDSDTDVMGSYLEGHMEYISVPMHFIIDKNGYISYSKIGYIIKAELTEELNKVI